MSHELVKTEQNQLPTIQSEIIDNWLAIFGSKLEPKEREQFQQIAHAFNLNPFKREIYCIAYGDGDNRQLSIITGFEVYLKRAELSGVLDGWKVWTEGDVTPKTVKKTMKKKDGGTWEKEVTVWSGDLKACIEISRKDRSKPFYHEVDYSEYTQDNEMWRTKRKTMIKKVAMSQGFRLCFPLEIGGMPYTNDELPDIITTELIETAEVIPEQKQPEVKTVPEKSVKEILKEAGISDDEYAEYNIAHKLNTADPKKVEAKIKANPAGAVNHIKEWKTGVITVAEKTINKTPGCSLLRIAEYCDTYNVPMIKFLIDLNLGKQTLEPVLSWIDADSQINNGDLPF